MPLFLLRIGEKARIIRLSGNPRLRRYLAEHGFLIGKMIKVIQQVFGDNSIICLDAFRLAINRKMANHIHICIEREGVYVPARS